jgi:hypothetical protein
LAKTGKDFQIRKSPKAAKGAQNQQSLTLSSFYRPDAIRDDPFPLPLIAPSPSPTGKAHDLRARLLENAQSLPPPAAE